MKSPNFQELIQLHKKGDSYADISRRAGGTPSAQTIQNLARVGFTRLPSPETFAGLAKALSISPRELVLAAARTIGIDVGDNNNSDLILWNAGKLPPESQDVLRNTAAELLNWMDGTRVTAEQRTNVVAFPDRTEPAYEELAASTEQRAEGREKAAHIDALGEESQERG